MVWLIGIAASLCGGLINWWSRARRSSPRLFNILEVLGELFASAVVGMLTYLACGGLELSSGVSAASAGVGGHMGTRLLFLVERKLESKFEANKRCLYEQEGCQYQHEERMDYNYKRKG